MKSMDILEVVGFVMVAAVIGVLFQRAGLTFPWSSVMGAAVAIGVKLMIHANKGRADD